MRRRTPLLAIVPLVALFVRLEGAPPPSARSESTITGGVFTHLVSRGETLSAIGARYAVDARTLAADNQLSLHAVLQIGQSLRVDNRHIVPPASETAMILVNVPQRMLFVRGEHDSAAFPVAVGRLGWRTPIEAFTVTSRRENPAWHVPASIREAARQAGRTLPAVVPPGPENPLGQFWLGLSISGVGIHGTNAPASIYQVATHGCIRLHPDDIAWLFPRVPLGASGRIVYEPVLLGTTEDEVFLEVHADVYRLSGPAREEVRRLADAAGVTTRVDWDAVERVVLARDGIARPVARR